MLVKTCNCHGRVCGGWRPHILTPTATATPFLPHFHQLSIESLFFLVLVSARLLLGCGGGVTRPPDHSQGGSNHCDHHCCFNPDLSVAQPHVAVSLGDGPWLLLLLSFSLFSCDHRVRLDLLGRVWMSQGSCPNASDNTNPDPQPIPFPPTTNG